MQSPNPIVRNIIMSVHVGLWIKITLYMCRPSEVRQIIRFLGIQNMSVIDLWGNSEVVIKTGGEITVRDNSASKFSRTFLPEAQFSCPSVAPVAMLMF
jgi:hypothetical protein